jgi:RHS repeat-associated protein
MASADKTRTEREGEQRSVTAPSIALPKGGGAIRGIGEKFAANPVTGAGSISVPLALSPARSGFSPQLSLSYDSGAGNGPFGFGWSLSIPAITRKTDKGLPRYCDADESDVFILSGAEDLVPALRSDGTRFEDDTSAAGYTIHRYRPRIEGLFARIERWTDKVTGQAHWRSISRDNVTTLYGKTPESRVSDPEDPRRIFSWLSCESYDDKGSAIVYGYAAENEANVDRSQVHERYLKRIRYGNRVSRLIEADLTAAEWLFEVIFDYDDGHYETVEPDLTVADAEQHHYVRAAAGPDLLWNSAQRTWSVRPDPFSSHRAGFEVRTYRRCRRVLMFHRFDELGNEPYLVRAIELDYADRDSLQPADVEGELTHHGSTRFGSFLCAVVQSGFVRDEPRPPIDVDGVLYATYLRRALPPLELEYSKAVIDDDVHELDAESVENLPAGIDGSAYQWVDLDGEGISGILAEQGGAWYYKPNLGEGHFGALETIASKPSGAALASGRQQLLDLDGNGRLDLVAFQGPAPGFYERTDDRSWERFKPFRDLPNVAWDEPNLRFVDLNGDGHADLLITEHEVFAWHPSLGDDGFGPAMKVSNAIDEERGPRVVLADGTQSIYLADMCGDGLTDLVRIRNGEVCYWPNQGYGLFGAKVTMDNAPWFDQPDQFDQRRIRVADVDGSGTNDIIYLGRDGARLYFNQSGNRWSGPRSLAQFPRFDNVTGVMTADLLGNGTACLIWSSPVPGSARRALRYIDLMGGQKPHLLTKSANNLGAETVVRYVASTMFYLTDKRAGNPWVTRLPFPVHVVERVETLDRVSRNRFVTRYAYHHGYYDGIERELRGFGMVEQTDTEEIAVLSSSPQLPVATNLDSASNVPTVLTRSWFHTGAHIGREHIAAALAGLLNDDDEGEYYREPGLSDIQARELLLQEMVFPAGLTADEEREACRALKGSLLRQEVYALDGTAREIHPYSVTEQNFEVRVLQSRLVNRHAVFLPCSRESISYHYERDPADPRISHSLTLAVDDYGNVLASATISYGRRQPDPSLLAAEQPEQTQLRVTYAENGFTNAVDGVDDHRTPLSCESRVFELTGLTLAPGRSRFTIAEFLAASTGAVTIPHEQTPVAGLLQKRLIEHVRSLYRSNDLMSALALGSLESLALPLENYRLAFTSGLLANVYGARVTAAMMENHGRYVHSEGDADWWIPSGRTFYSPVPSDTPAQEVAFAGQHFFLPQRHRDPFHTSAVSTESIVTYDAHDLLIAETRDALGNRVTAANDYRVLQPWLVTDPNGNRTAVSFDALGMVVGTAVMGKPLPATIEGDSLDGFVADLTDAVLQDHLVDPLASPQTILGRATSRLVYDLFGHYRTKNTAEPQPCAVYTLARETHDADPVPAGGLKIRHNFTYGDGLGREIQKKVQAEAGPVPVRDSSGAIVIDTDGRPQMTPNDVHPRWVGTGWTVFNNKGKPVRQFEPFFTDTHRFEFDVRIGVSRVLFHDPIGRIVATLHPNHTWEKTVFSPWRRETWDANDTVLVADPTTDADVGDFFRRLPDAAYLPSWLDQRQSGALGPQEQAAANKAAVHAATPTVIHADSLGRTFVTVAHNRFKFSDSPIADPPVEEFHRTRVVLDVEGNERAAIDANGRLIMRYDYAMAGPPDDKEDHKTGHRIHQASMDAGERWMLDDVAGHRIVSWDSRDQRLRTVHDPLRRPTDTFLQPASGPELLVGRMVYGEGAPNAEVRNLHGRVIEIFDQAGVVTNDEYDFKGNLLQSARQLAREYKTTVDWSALVPLEQQIHGSKTFYDALNRTTKLIAPDQSVIRPSYSEAGLLERLDVNLRGAAMSTPFVTEIDYDAKGQRQRVDYGNGVKTIYHYDRFTFRLTHLLTRRDPVQFPDDCPTAPPLAWPGCQLQSFHYRYDPVGNITHIRDAAQQTRYFLNRRIEPNADYTYDAVYRLIEATGREHLGTTGGQRNPPVAPDGPRGIQPPLLHPGDGNAMGTYLERYVYDFAHNIVAMEHRGSDPVHPGWTRTYAYAEPSSLESGATNNRLSTTTVGSATETFHYDGSAGLHGNITSMPHLPLMEWNERDQLRATARQVVVNGTPETTWYVYDAQGRRVRKVTERQTAGPLTPTRKDDRVYLAGFEIYRAYEQDGVTVSLERETLHVMDEGREVALVETRTVDNGNDPSPAQLIRYQCGNHLRSVSLELDEQAQIISYEEHTPYGSTSYRASRNALETPSRYRYAGKERDEESGLDSFGIRSYASWLGRWCSVDPLLGVAGYNGFEYARSSPVMYVDRDGRQPVTALGDADLFLPLKPLSPHQKRVAAAKGKQGFEPYTIPMILALEGPYISPAKPTGLGFGALTVWGASASISSEGSGVNIFRWGQDMGGGKKLNAYMGGVELRLGGMQLGYSARYTRADGPKALLQNQGVGVASVTWFSARSRYFQIASHNDLFILRGLNLPFNWDVNKDMGDTAGIQLRAGNLQNEGLTDITLGMRMATGMPTGIVASPHNPAGQYTVQFSEVSRGDLYLKLGFQWGGWHLDTWVGMNSREALHFVQTEVIHRHVSKSPDFPKTTGSDFFGGLTLSYSIGGMKVRKISKPGWW